MRCPTCGGTMVLGRETVAHPDLPGVRIADAEVWRCPTCGEDAQGFPAEEALHQVLAEALIRQPGRLDGRGVRFLRAMLGLSGVELAEAFGTTAETVSRWERGHTPIGPQAERLLRVLVARQLGLAFDVAQLGSLTGGPGPAWRLARWDGGTWRLEEGRAAA